MSFVNYNIDFDQSTRTAFSRRCADDDFKNNCLFKMLSRDHQNTNNEGKMEGESFRLGPWFPTWDPRSTAGGGAIRESAID